MIYKSNYIYLINWWSASYLCLIIHNISIWLSISYQFMVICLLPLRSWQSPWDLIVFSLLAAWSPTYIIYYIFIYSILLYTWIIRYTIDIYITNLKGQFHIQISTWLCVFLPGRLGNLMKSIMKAARAFKAR